MKYDLGENYKILFGTRSWIKASSNAKNTLYPWLQPQLQGSLIFHYMIISNLILKEYIIYLIYI